MADKPAPWYSRLTRWGIRAAAAGSAALLVVSTAGTAAAAPADLSSSAVPARILSWPALHPSLVLESSYGTRWGDALADWKAKAALGRNAAVADPGSLYTIQNAIGARAVWRKQDAAGRQITGKGIGVALLDSGVSPVPGLDKPGKLVLGPDLSIEANGDLAYRDTFGHGTHLAGIIAARDTADLSATNIGRLSPDTQLGVAPDATIEALKLATTDGSTDVSQVIAALDWITQHQYLPDGTRIRVVNLAFGTDSQQAYQSDPLAAAAENAWRHGLVVVVSGGNEGPDAGRLTNPAIDPYVIAVGASDGGGTVAGWWQPGVAPFSSSGSPDRYVDILAPGKSIVSLRDPGSFVDVTYPQGRVDGDTEGRLFRGSGTSQAAAVVSGAVALLLQAYPNLTPDQVKRALTVSATPVLASPLVAGAGQINVAAALAVAERMSRGDWPNAAQSWPISEGQGSIEAARGGSHLLDPAGLELNGEIDVQGQPWDPAAWWAASSTLTAWQGGWWNGSVWTGDGWESDIAASWASARWSSARWSGARWSSARWSDANWGSARWSDADWMSARWSSARWSSARWSGNCWS
jgi:serine protease AprX